MAWTLPYAYLLHTETDTAAGSDKFSGALHKATQTSMSMQPLLLVKVVILPKAISSIKQTKMKSKI